MTGPDFIFMLTRDDATVPDALDHVATALRAGVRHIGFKDVGLPFIRLRELAEAIREGGARSYLEVVSLDRESEIASAEAAVGLGVDVLMGGTRPRDVLPVIKASAMAYYPFCGRIAGHPSRLEGTEAEIVASAREIAATEGVHGLDLLAWRSRTDAAALIGQVNRAIAKPLIVAGSIDREERVAAVARGGAAAFTIGTAVLDGRFPAVSGGNLESRLRAVLALAGS